MAEDHFERAGMLQAGASYYLRRQPGSNGLPAYTRVIFIDITTCPAVVVVQDERKVILRCNRADLYISEKA